MEQVLLVGAARSGIACAKLLVQKGYQVVLNDGGQIQNQDQLEAMGIQCVSGGHPEHLLEKEYAFVVKNPGIPYHNPFIQKIMERGLSIFTEIEIASRYAPNFAFGAITGTNGKTTITTLLGEMLLAKGHGAIAGNIGVPLSQLVYEQGQARLDVALELSNFQLLGTTTFHPKVSTITNLTPDHLDYMGSVEAYYASKCKIYENQTQDDWFILNLDDANVVAYANNIPANVVTLSLQHEADLCVRNGVAMLYDTALFEVQDLKIVGIHNVYNAIIAAAMAYLMDTPLDTIQQVLHTFTGVKHRLQFLGTQEGVSFYNDSKATNPEASATALQAFADNIILLAGGYDKHLPFDLLKQYDARVKCCIGFGATAHKIASTFSRSQEVTTLEEAFETALSIAQPGDVILLAPACASFDQFTSFEQRGDRFIALVEQTKAR